MIIKKFPWLLRADFRRLRYAYGICSKVRDHDGYHYLLFDCDADVDMEYFFKRYKSPIVFYRSRSGKGVHVIVFMEMPFPQAIGELLDCPYTDRAYVSFAVRRGYMFLETTIPLFWKDLSYMMIERER